MSVSGLGLSDRYIMIIARPQCQIIERIYW